MESAFWGLIGTVVGALASIATTWVSSRASQKIQEEKAREDRLSRENAFQRDTLIALQEAIHNALRLIVRAHHADILAYRETKVWGKNFLPVELDEELRLARRQVAILVERVSNDAVRTEVKSFMNSASLISHTKSAEEAENIWFKVSATGSDVLERIGTTLRLHY